MAVWKDILNHLDQRQPLPPLRVDTVWDEALSEEIERLTGTELVGEGALSHQVQSTRAGLLLWNDDVARAHVHAQALTDATGSYWHALVHRREGDYENARYWFRNVGTHPVYASVYRQASRLWAPCQTWGTWQPERFIEAVAHAVTVGEQTHPEAESLRRIQVVEFSFLLRYGLGMN
ncbi:MAG: hypothetical protein K6T31_08490 [Alicyclobacillus sp.]|nr:hypothetical protein [Alicyclobacillus sp.]